MESLLDLSEIPTEVLPRKSSKLHSRVYGEIRLGIVSNIPPGIIPGNLITTLTEIPHEDLPKKSPGMSPAIS